MSSRSVQFRDPEKLLDAYENLQIPAFAISSGTQLLGMRYTGDDMEDGAQLLEGFLKILTDNLSNAIYTLRLYEDLKKGTPITNKTPYNGSFNFCFIDYIAQLSGIDNKPGMPDRYQGGGIAQHVYNLHSDVKELKEALALLLESKQQPEEKEESIGNVVLQAMLPMLPQIIDGIMKSFQPKQPGQINGITVDVNYGFNEIEAGRILEGCRQLRNSCKDVPGTIEKLARYAEKNPALFSVYLGMLK